MAPISPGKAAGPPRKPRKQTQTTKSHRFEPFSKRVSKLKIDPVHKVQQSRLKDARDDLSQSHFRSALEEWSELNLTTTFTSFFNQVNPLCESLPQLLHHADQIVQSLLEHIEKQDPLALEALVSHVAHLAHDLGQGFEKYFAETVKLVAKVATIQEDPGVIESCFNCLAWMYKYLSRHLVQDLTPLLDILLPYFSARKEYIRRFIAESLAFLLRKAATTYHRDFRPLMRAVGHLVITKAESIARNDTDAFAESCMTLLAESAAGVDAGLHSSATDLFTCIYGLALSSPPSNPLAMRILEGFTVNLIHRTDADGFRCVQDAILEQAKTAGKSEREQHTVSRLLVIIVGTRGGSRIEQWTDILHLLLTQLSDNSTTKSSDAVFSENIKAAAAAIQNAPLDQLLPYSSKLIQAVAVHNTSSQFFIFCDAIARLGKSRFQDLVLPQLQQFIISHWRKDPSGTTLLLCDLSEMECVSKQGGRVGYTDIGDDWEQCITKTLRNEFPSVQDVSVHLLLNRSVHFPKMTETLKSYKNFLSVSVRTALSQKSVASLENRLSLGWGLQTLLDISDVSLISHQQYHEMLHQPNEAFHLLPYVQALEKIASANPVKKLSVSLFDSIVLQLSGNLLNASIDLRKASVQLLGALRSDEPSSHKLGETAKLLFDILDTPYTISNARRIAMLVRRLPHLHSSLPSNTSLLTIIPTFSLGLLRDYHDKLRLEVASVLGQMMTDARTVDHVLQILKDWLQTPDHPSMNSVAAGDNIPGRISPYECTRLNAVLDEYSKSAIQFTNPAQTIRDKIEVAHELLSTRSPPDARLIALQVLNEVPQVAEKRSKMIVPSFLAAQKSRSGYSQSFEQDESTSINTLTPDIEEHNWSLKERKLFLQLLGQFSNPRVLYRADDVYTVLLELLSNGDPETRKLALTAVLKWKNKALVAQQDALLQVAEDKRTTSELALMLNGDQCSDPEQAINRAEVLAILLRLLFGQLIGRVGVHGSQEAKRKALLRLVFRMTQSEVFSFLDIVLGRLREVDMSDAGQSSKNFLSQDLIPADQQFGFLRMTASMLDILQSQFEPFGSKLVDAVLYCTARASYQINQLKDASPALIRSIRRAGLQCLNLLLEHCPGLDLISHQELIWSQLISSRLHDFVAENSQGISGLLRMFSLCMRSKRRLKFLMKHDHIVLNACWGLLASELTKPAVKTFMLEDIVGPLFDMAEMEDDEQLASSVVKVEASHLLGSLALLLQQNPPKELLLNASTVVQRLAVQAPTDSAKKKVIELMVTILSEPNQRLQPHIKGQILKAVDALMDTVDASVERDYDNSLLPLVSSYFDFFRDVPNRQTCARLLAKLSRNDSQLQEAAMICEMLNSQPTTALHTTDYEAQSAAYEQIHNMLETPNSYQTLLPILHNLIFFMRTSEDTASRGSALGCLKHLVKATAESLIAKCLISKVLLNAIQRHLRDDSETVRADFVELLGVVVQYWKSEQSLRDLEVLLVGNDEEASFFTNILHIQQHRRTRAMRRLITEVEAGKISADNLADYFLPLFQKFAVDESPSDTAQTTKGQSIASMTTLLQWLDWKTFRRVFRQYRQSLEQKPRDEKVDVRLLNQAADALSTAIKGRTEAAPQSHLAATLPAAEVIAQELKTHLIPKLAELSHYKDEGEVSERLPAAVVAIKLIKLLPENEVSILATPVVLDIAQTLRSRTQDVRDLARNKLAEVVSLLGPSSIQFVVRELRTALTRGYQLHVLSYTVHTILLATAEQRSLGDLDYCLEDLVKVVLDDIFGIVGQEKDNQDYVSSMKEVKSSKSFDSMEILARCTSVKYLSQLVLPLETLLSGNLTSKQLRHVDELFRRIGVGISHSSAASSQDLLVLAFELIQSFYASKPSQPTPQLTNDEKNRDRFIVQKDNTARVGAVSYSSLLHKIAKFAIDIARSTFARHSELMIPQNVHGFIPIAGDALVEAQYDVKISAMRLLSTIMKLKMPELTKNAKLYVIEAVKVVKGSTSTNEEAAQAALKLVAAVIRDKDEVEVRESDIAYLLKRTMPDLEEPDRQGITFNFLKAVMARRMQIPELYELLDNIAAMMVTSQSRSSRDAARGVYVHFLLHYPQGKNRWSKQIKFLVKNLDYKYPEGRQSVMEALNTLLSKVDEDTAEEIATVIFIPVVLRMANDDHEKCREMAGALLSQIFRTTAPKALPNVLQPLRSWLEQEDNATLRKISLQAWSIYFKADPATASEEVSFVRGLLIPLLSDPDKDSSNWEMEYHALELLYVTAEQFPSLMLTAQQRSLWLPIVNNVASPHTWLQSSASRFVGLYLGECVKADSTTIPLASSHGLMLDESTAISLLRASMRALKRSSTSQDLADAVLPNLLFIGRALDGSDARLPLTKQDISTEESTSMDSESEDDESASDGENGETNGDSLPSISVAQYLLDQSARTLRREPPKQTSSALQPKVSIVVLIQNWMPHLTDTSLAEASVSLTSLLVPLLHMTSTTTSAPRSSDPGFGAAYQNLIEQSQLLLEAIQARLGDQGYAQLVTSATRQAREKRQKRRNKRAIETIAEPERAAREKRRKFERKKERRKEIKGIHRSHRRRDLGF